MELVHTTKNDINSESFSSICTKLLLTPMLHDDNMIIGSTLILPTPKFGAAMVGMTAAATVPADECGLLACHKTRQAEQHHRSRRQLQRPRECCHTADESKGNTSRRAYRVEQANNNGHILTPEMLNACNSRSLRRLVSNDTRVDINTTTRSSSTSNAGTRMFRSDQSITYFTTDTGRIIPTNTWTMHQAQQHQQLLQQHQHQQQHQFPDTIAVHQQNSKSNPILAWCHSPSNPTEKLKYSAVMATSVSPALMDESVGNNPMRSDSRRQFAFPTNDRTSDLPFFPTLGHCHQGRRRHTVPSTVYVEPPSDLSSTPRRTSNQYVRGDDAIAAIPSNRGKIEEERSPLSPMVKSKAPDPPSTPYIELKTSSTAVMAKQVQARISHGCPMTSLRRSASLPTTRTDFVPQKDIPLSDDRSNHEGIPKKSSSCSTLNSSALKQGRRHSLPITSKSENDQSLFSKSMNDIELRSGRTMMICDDTSVSYSRSHHGQEEFHEHCHQYQVGEILRDESHSIAFTSVTQALILLSKLPLNSPIFVKRTSREWTCATLVSWIAEQRQQSSDNDEELFYSLVASLHSTRNVKKILKMDRWEKCLRLVNTKAVTTDGLACTTAAAASPTSVAAVTHLPCDGTSPRASFKATMNSSATSPNSMCSTMSGLYSTANTVTSSTTSADIIAGNPYVVRNLFPTVDAHETEPKNSSDRSLTMTASLNNLHSKKISWGLTPSSDDDVSSKSEATPLRSGSKASSTPDSDKTISDCSPTTVNLHARHFWGSRRDRMRPRGTHRNKPSSSRGCVSLGNENNSAQRMWCDSTCAPESGSFSDASGGSVWNTLLEKNSGTEHDPIPTLPYYFPSAPHS